MTTKLLTAGEYTIPDEHTIKRDGNKVIVRPKIKHHTQISKHCRDCRYIGRGKTSNGFYTESSACLKRTKPNGNYYTAYPQDKACYEFEERVEPRGC